MTSASIPAVYAAPRMTSSSPACASCALSMAWATLFKVVVRVRSVSVNVPVHVDVDEGLPHRVAHLARGHARGDGDGAGARDGGVDALVRRDRPPLGDLDLPGRVLAIRELGVDAGVVLRGQRGAFRDAHLGGAALMVERCDGDLVVRLRGLDRAAGDLDPDGRRADGSGRVRVVLTLPSSYPGGDARFRLAVDFTRRVPDGDGRPCLACSARRCRSCPP